MKIKVVEYKRMEKEIDVEFPYYFKWGFDNTEIFGKINNEYECFEITETKDEFWSPKIYTIKIDIPDSSCYELKDKSCEYDFESVKNRMLKFVGKV